MEETGLAIRGHALSSWCRTASSRPEFYKKAHFILLNYTALAAGGKVVLNDEAEDHRWVHARKVAATMDLNHADARILLDHVRSHSHR